MTVESLVLALQKQIENGYGSLQVVILDPLRAEGYFRNEIQEFPLTTVEDVWVYKDFVEPGRLAIFLER